MSLKGRFRQFSNRPEAAKSSLSLAFSAPAQFGLRKEHLALCHLHYPAGVIRREQRDEFLLIEQ
jgi:hypothetical protein